MPALGPPARAMSPSVNSGSGRTLQPGNSARARLLPSLFDRLIDEVAPALEERLGQARGALEASLNQPPQTALAELLESGRAEDRLPVLPETGILTDLGENARVLLGRVLEFERARRSALRRTVALTGAQLRAAVLRDLQHLLNTTAAESQSDGNMDALTPWPCVKASVLNYGVPAIAGRIRTPDDLDELARQLEVAINRHEPRLHKVRVRPGDEAGSEPGALTNPVELVIEGELLAYPLSEHVLVRTLLDLEAGRVTVPDQGWST